MTQNVGNRTSFSLVLALALVAAFSTSRAMASPPASTPKPPTHDRQDKDFDDSSEMTPPVSRFKHRHDYREEEADKAEQAAAQKKIDLDNAAKAREAALQAVKDKNDASLNANNRGVALGQQHRWVEAITAHEEACQLDPRSKQFRINLSAARCAYGQEKLAEGDLNSAASLFRKAKVAAPDNGLADKLLIATLKKQGRDPSNVDTRLELGDQLAAVGDLEGAYIEYEAAMQLQPSAHTYTKMGDVSLQYGQGQKALNYYREAIAKDAEYGPAQRQLGMIALSQKDFSTAASYLRKALLCDSKDAAAGDTLVQIWRKQVASSPNLPSYHLGLAGALQLTGAFADADAEYRQAEALDPRNPNLAAGRLSLQKAIQHAEADKYAKAADTLFNQGLQREALAEVGRAVTMEPHNAKYQFKFGECLEANGDYQGAHQAYMNCVLLDPEHNSEAAARIREMEHSLGGRVNFQPAPPKLGVAMPQFSQPSMMASSGPVPQQQATQPAAAAMSAAGQGQPQPQLVSPQEAARRAMQDAMNRVADLESQKKYDDAVDLLKQIVARNLQSADLHHQLAVDLLAGGAVNDAVSEFRLACALRPDRNDYAADLARAMAIHKRALADANNAPAEVTK